MLKLSLIGLKSNQSALQCILVLYKITSNGRVFCDEKEHPKYAAIMKKKEGEATRQDLLNELVSKEELLEYIYKEFRAYLQNTEGHFSKLLAANATNPFPVKPEELVVLGRFPHLRNIRERLDYLNFIYEFSDAKLDEESVDTIWDALMSNTRVKEEQRLCLGYDTPLFSFPSLILLFSKKLYAYPSAGGSMTSVRVSPLKGKANLCKKECCCTSTRSSKRFASAIPRRSPK